MAVIILIQAGHEFTYSGWSGGQIEIIGGASSGTVVQSNVKVCDSAVVHIINAASLPSSPLSTIPSQPSHSEPGNWSASFFSTCFTMIWFELKSLSYTTCLSFLSWTILLDLYGTCIECYICQMSQYIMHKSWPWFFFPSVCK